MLMNTGIKIKVCGMRNPENIKGLVALKPDFIGLIFYPKSKRYVSESKAESIISAIPTGIKKVGVFVNALQADIVRIAHLFKLDFIQLHGDESPEYCMEFKDLNLSVIKAFGITEDFDFVLLDNYKNTCEYYLFDTKSDNYGGTGEKFNWQTLDNYKDNKPFFLSGGIGQEDIPAIKKLKLNHLFALDVNSKFEIEPAVKNTEQLSAFINEFKPTK